MIIHSKRANNQNPILPAEVNTELNKNIYITTHYNATQKSFKPKLINSKIKTKLKQVKSQRLNKKTNEKLIKTEKKRVTIISKCLRRSEEEKLK